MLVDVIGPEAAMNLFIRFNGRALHIPQPENLYADHVVTQTIGADKADLLCKRFACEDILFPKGAYLLRKIRNENIISDWRAGMTQPDLATKYDLTTRSINGIISNFKNGIRHYGHAK